MKNKVGQKVDEVWMEVGQYLDKSWTDFDPQQLLQFFSNTSPEIKRFSLKRLSQQLPNDYPENKAFSLSESVQNQDEICTENCVKVAVWLRYLRGIWVGQFLGETGVDLGAFYLAKNLIIQPLSCIAHSFIVHNKRVQDKWLDVPELFLYVVLPDQSL